ncbi:hypothetical protein A33Q_3868 [Indibacter alkaliphilus LW1]|uniref:Outer membrane porin, OprD family n=1 Tax=Indibacter alkaliphilus (strain CCUG 57479 / KCTC 22604 / LW1) TaxID=1189612 RepID=S2DTW6_INDAL|nr:OprD family outer membrane porin [Indibacter alkaliphilus]EOZ93278.1 hypothetical protein A33Q_3868 [Indibacter alkaliphilus LW1]
MFRSLVLFILLLFAMQVNAQNELSSQDSAALQSRKLGEDLKKGEVDFHIKSFFMSTINKGELLDYSTLATGAGIGYTTPEWKGFQVRFNGFFTFQLFENNIRIADPATGAGNRYEILLYDMNDVNNTNKLDRLEELYLSYRKNRFRFKLGRQKVQSPLLNEQDNRMRPNVFGGLSAVYAANNWKLTAMWIESVTIRGTVDWYSVEDSYGVYPFGRNPFGQPSGYKGNVDSKGIAMLGTQFHKNGWTIQGWNYLAENVFNLTFGQVDYQKSLDNGIRLHAGLQSLHQFAVNDGGNSESEKTYIMPNENVTAVGGKLGVFYRKHNLSFNFLGINDNGRFLFPREWGRENLYASLPRERYEGSGSMRAYVVKYDLVTPVKGLFSQFGAGLVNHSDVTDFRTNKYGIPSYYHFTGSVDYRFKDYFEGLNLQLLIANKTAKEPSLVPENLRINRVDLWNINIIMDYKF